MTQRVHGTAGAPSGVAAFVPAIVALLVFDAVMLIAGGAVLWRHGTVTWRAGFAVSELPPPGFVVTSVSPGGPAADRLHPGDRIVAVDGDRRLNRETLQLLSRSFAAGPRLTIVRDGRVDEVALPPLAVPLRAGVPTTIVAAPPALALLVAGGAVGLLRPLLPSARLFATASLLAVPTVFTKDARRTQRAVAFATWEEWIVCLAHLTSPLHLVAALGFLFGFPDRPRAPRLIRRTGILTAAAGVAAWATSATIDFSETVFRPAAVALAWTHPLVWRALDALVNFYPVAAFSLMVVVVITKYRATPSPVERRRLAWLSVGAVGGLLPLAAYFLIVAVAPLAGRGSRVPPWLGDAAFLWVTVLPLTIGYAVTRHQLFDIRVIVRRGLQYLLARNSLRAALTASIGMLVLEVVRDPTVPVGELAGRPLVPAVLATATALLYFRTRIIAALDRRFFRSAYDFERVLMSIVERIGTQHTPHQIAELVSGGLESSLHPESLQVYLRDERGTLVRQHGSGDVAEAWAPLALDNDADLVRALERTGRTTRVNADRRLEAVAGDAAGAAVQLAVPVGGSDRRLAGVLLLGAKRSEEPYSPRDVQLLETVAAQMLMAHENVALRQRISEEQRVRQQVLARLDAHGVNLVRECPTCGLCYDSAASQCSRDGETLVVTHSIEQIVGGRWRLERRLGAGGMGAVYEATDCQLTRRVALKVMRGDHPLVSHWPDRFEREARVLARLNHAHIVTLYDAGHADPGGAFIVMELVDGSTLRDELHLGAVDLPLFVDWFDQILDAVSYAHRHDVIHRDLKPENIILTMPAEGRRVAKVLDFGLAKFHDAAGGVSNVTHTGAVVGTLAYMAPEQLLGQPADRRSDLFALGVIAIEAITGRHPFRHAQSGVTAGSILDGDNPLLAGDWPSPVLQAALVCATARRPDDRFGSVDQFRAEVIPALRASPAIPGAVRRIRPRRSDAPAPDHQRATPSGQDTEPC